MYICMALLVKNQCKNVPSGGIIEGYLLVFCAASSSADSRGPGYLGASLGNLDPCDGGLNFVGFSRTSGFDGLELFLGAAFLEAWRMAWDVVEGAGRRARHMRPL
jgi:hypothetical protein